MFVSDLCTRAIIIIVVIIIVIFIIIISVWGSMNAEFSEW